MYSLPLTWAINIGVLCSYSPRCCWPSLQSRSAAGSCPAHYHHPRAFMQSSSPAKKAIQSPYCSGGGSLLPSCRTCFSLLNFTRYLLAHPSSLWSLGSCVPTGLSIVPPNLMPSENLVRPHSIACSRSLIKTLNRTYLVVHPSRLCCLNMDMWIVWEMVSCYKVNDIHTSPHSPLLCAVTRVSRFSFSQTL